MRRIVFAKNLSIAKNRQNEVKSCIRSVFGLKKYKSEITAPDFEPTISNLEQLSKELGDKAYKGLIFNQQKPNSTAAAVDAIDAIKLRSSLNNSTGLSEELKNIPEYQSAKQYWKENIAPTKDKTGRLINNIIDSTDKDTSINTLLGKDTDTLNRFKSMTSDNGQAVRDKMLNDIYETATNKNANDPINDALKLIEKRRDASKVFFTDPDEKSILDATEKMLKATKYGGWGIQTATTAALMGTGHALGGGAAGEMGGAVLGFGLKNIRQMSQNKAFDIMSSRPMFNLFKSLAESESGSKTAIDAMSKLKDERIKSLVGAKPSEIPEAVTKFNTFFNKDLKNNDVDKLKLSEVKDAIKKGPPNEEPPAQIQTPNSPNPESTSPTSSIGATNAGQQETTPMGQYPERQESVGGKQGQGMGPGSQGQGIAGKGQSQNVQETGTKLPETKEINFALGPKPPKQVFRGENGSDLSGQV